MSALRYLAPVALAATLFGAFGACNNGTANCPAKATITPGGSCSDDELQCAYDLATPDPSCDGTTTSLETSCTCTKGKWECPDPFECGDTSAGDDAAAGDDGATGDDGSTVDAPSE